ncbi:MAG: RsiV family protein [Eubacteriales bacterium]|nr:RsiV family protein [Eubacteriales bacterium]
MTKRRLLSILLVLAMVFSLAACKKEETKVETEAATTAAVAETTKAPETTAAPEETKPEVKEPLEMIHPEIDQLNVYETAKAKDKEAYVAYGITCQTVSLDDDEAEQYPELNKALEEATEARRKYAKDTLVDLKAQAADIAEYRNEEDYYDYLSSDFSEYILRSDNRVLSIHTSYTDYWGGAHGYYFDFGTAYDVKTGEEIELIDVVADQEGFKAAVKAEIEDYYDKEYHEYIDFETAMAFIDGFFGEGDYAGKSIDMGWTLGYNGVTVYFYPYSLGAYAMGQPTATVTFAEYPGVLNEEYAEIPANYISQIERWVPQYYDIDGDGKNEEITAYVDIENYEDYDAYTDMCIVIDGKENHFGTYTFENYELYLCVIGKKSYIYLNNRAENDYRYLRIYEITDGRVTETGMYQGYPASLGYAAGEMEIDNEVVDYYIDYHAAFVDPDYMLLSSRLDALGTYDALRFCKVGADGIPTGGELYFPVSDITLTVKKTFELTTSDEKGTDTGEPYPVNPGETLTIFATNGEDKIILQAENGDFLLGYINREEWPYRINYYPEDEVLDGIVYAG